MEVVVAEVEVAIAVEEVVEEGAGVEVEVEIADMVVVMIAGERVRYILGTAIMLLLLLPFDSIHCAP